MSLRIRNYELSTNKVTKSVNLLNLTDIHSNILHLKNIIKKLDIINPDLITISGDLLDSINDPDNDDLLIEVINMVNNYPTYIVLGNHDYVSIRKGIKKNRKQIDKIPFYNLLGSKSNAHLLINNDEKYRFNDEINIYGMNLDNSWYKDKKENKELFDKHLNEYLKKMRIEKNKFNIFLFHSPNALVNNGILTEVNNINLILCGHNHAGITPEIIQKISKKHIGLVGPYSGWFPRDAYGYWTTNNTSLVLSNGVTKMGRSHFNKLVRNIVNESLRCDAEIIKIVPGSEHRLELKSIEVLK